MDGIYASLNYLGFGHTTSLCVTYRMTKATSTDITVTFTDSGSGVTLIQQSTNGTTWTNVGTELTTGVSSLTKTITVNAASGTRYFRAKDAAGNYSESKTVSF